MIESSLVLIGSFRADRKGETFGTGFIVKYKDQLYIVSCKHVYSEVKDKNSIFAIPGPKQTMNPFGGYAIIHLDKPNYHPDDDNSNTYDIVVFKLINTSERSLSLKNINPLEIDNFSFPLSSNNQEIFAAGFPVDHIKRLVANNSEDVLPPKIATGREIKLKMSQLSQKGFTGKLIEGFFIKKNDFEFEMGKGSSGGLIFRENEEKKLDIIGLMLGEGKIELISSEKIISKMNIIIFAQTKRIIEIITNIEKIH